MNKSIAQIYLATDHIFILGFSGVVFGLFGFLCFYIPRKLVVINAVLVLSYHLILMLYVDNINLAWAVHLFGFLGGMMYQLTRKKQ